MAPSNGKASKLSLGNTEEDVEKVVGDRDEDEGDEDEEDVIGIETSTGHSVLIDVDEAPAMVDSMSESALKKSSKDDSTSAGSLRYSEMHALKPSSISSNGTISSKSVASLLWRGRGKER